MAAVEEKLFHAIIFTSSASNDGFSPCVDFCHPAMGQDCPVEFENKVGLRHLSIFNRRWVCSKIAQDKKKHLYPWLQYFILFHKPARSSDFPWKQFTTAGKTNTLVHFKNYTCT